jgi:hypothetical protein
VNTTTMTTPTVTTATVTTALAAETRKLHATRSTWFGLLAVLVLSGGLAVANVLLSGTEDNPALSAQTLDNVLRAPIKILAFAMLLIGVLAGSGEYRHRTIIPTLLAEPRRSRMVAAKVLAVARLGVLAALATAAVSAAVGVPMLVAREAPSPDLGAPVLGVVTMAGLAAGYGVLGVALGLLLRNQAAAVTVAVVWQFVVENILPVVLRAPGMSKALPGGAADSLARLGRSVGEGMLPPWQGALVFAGYTAALVAAALLVSVPRHTA